MPSLDVPQIVPLPPAGSIDSSLKDARSQSEVSLDKAEKQKFGPESFTVAVQAVTTNPAQPEETHLLAAIGSFSKSDRPARHPHYMDIDKTPRQEDITKRSSWLCDSIFALDAHVKNQPSLDPQQYPYQNFNPHTDISGTFAAYRRLSLPPGFTLGRGGPFDVEQTMAQPDSELPKEIDGIEVNPEWGLTKAGKARQRLPIACTNCRGKKIKCLINKDGGPCHNCQKSDNLKNTCRTEGRPRRQSSAIRRDKSKSRKRSTTRRPSLNEGDDSSTGFSRASSRDFGDDESLMFGTMDSALLATSMSLSVPGGLAVFPPDLGPELPRPSHLPSDSPVSTMSDRSRQLSLESIASSYQPLFTSGYSLDNEGQYDPRLFGTSHAQHEPRQLSPLTKFNPTSFPKQTRIQLPDEGTVRKLAELFFTHLHWQGYGFLQPIPFLQNLTNQSPVLLLCICAASCRLSDELRATNFPRILEAQAKQAALGERFNPTLTTIQSFLLLAFHYSATGDIEQANSYSDIAISMLKAIRLGEQINEKLKREERMGRSALDQSIETWKRTFWSAYIQDRGRHLTEAQTSEQRLAASDIPLPCREEDFDLRDGVKGTEGAFDRTQGQNTGIMGYLVKVTDIRARLLNHLKVTCTHLPQVFPNDSAACDTKKLSAELRIWEETLPDEYRFSADNFKGHFDGEHSTIETISLMFLIYHVTLNQLHRYQDGKEDFTEHYLPCFNHALSVLAILRTVSKYNDEVARPVGKRVQLVSPFVPFAVAIACDTIGRVLSYLPEKYILEHGRLLAHPKISLFFSARKYLRESLQSLRSYMHRTKAAADCYVMIRKLCFDIREACTDGIANQPAPDPSGPHCVPGVCINRLKLRSIAPTMIPLNNTVVDILYHGDYFGSWYHNGGSQDIERLTTPATDRQRQSPGLPEISSDRLRMATTPLAHTTTGASEGYVTAVQLPQSTLAVFNLKVDESEMSQAASPLALPQGTTTASSAQGSPMIGHDTLSSHSGSLGLSEGLIPLSHHSTGSNLSLGSSVNQLPMAAGALYSGTGTPEWPATDVTGVDMLGLESLNFMDVDATGQEMPLDFSMEDLLAGNTFPNTSAPPS